MEQIKEWGKALWNKFVDGFETGVYQLLLLGVGVADWLDMVPLKDYLPEKLGPVVAGMSLFGLSARYFITLPWFTKFKDVP